MKTRILGNRAGMTMMEVMICAGLLTMVLLATLALMSNMLNIWSLGASGTSANSYSSLAIRKLVLEIEEGRSASVVNGQLVVLFPYYDTSTGDYIRTQTGNTVTYYLSGESGVETSGTVLWKRIGTNRTRLANNVQSVTFTTDSSKLVRIQLTGFDQEGGAISPNLVRISVKLRNS